ncbi:MAG TPA: serine/threonine-protein kinase [Polyangiales bacterium]|nr:serine/threonine-protein kinase [Polyangiales bacterium]
MRLTRQLGQGGMGSVWAALHQTLGREVAVKFLQPQVANSQVLEDRFESEAKMVASIKNRFVVDVFDFGVTEDGLHYMVLELLHGRSLADRMDHGPAMPVRQAVKLMADCLRGLHVVHEAGIIHRDLKPDNIFIIEDTEGAFPKLIDFGISRRTDPPNLKLNASEARSSRLTQPGVVLGTPYYMSPEQLRGKQSVDARSDIYSFGVILYELLAGHLPFRQDNIGDLMVAITVTGAPALAVLRPELGQRLSDVVARAMHPAPEKRYADARELRKALLELLPQLPLQAMCVIQNIVDTHPGRGEPLEWAEPMPAETREAPHSLPVTRFSWSTRVRRSATLMVAAGVALLTWLAIHQLTADRQLSTEPVHAAITPRIQSRVANSRFTLSPLEVIELQPRAAPSVAEHTIDAPPLAAMPVPDNNSESTKASAADEPAAAPKHARERVRARDNNKARSSSADRPQRLYKKLDF